MTGESRCGRRPAGGREVRLRAGGEHEGCCRLHLHRADRTMRMPSPVVLARPTVARRAGRGMDHRMIVMDDMRGGLDAGTRPCR